MAIKFSAIRKTTRTVTVLFDGTEDTLTVEYKPHTFTPKFLDEYQRAIAEGHATDALCDLFAEVMAEWDLLLDDGTPVPFTREALQELSFGVLGMVVEAVMANMQVNPTKQTNSINGTGRKGGREVSPAGSF